MPVASSSSMETISETTPLLVAPSPNHSPGGQLSLGLKTIGLLMMSVVGFGAFFCFDNPGALQSEIKKDLNITTTDFANLYAWYSWPNVILPVIGGILIDRFFGVRCGTIIFSLIVLMGQVVFSLGGLFNTFFMMCFGRFIFGIGGESLNMALNTFTVKWFRGNALNMVLGLQLSVARVGSTFNFIVMRQIYQYFSTKVAGIEVIGCTLLAATVCTAISLIGSLLLGWLDYKKERAENNNRDSTEETREEVASLSEVAKFPASFWLLCLATLSYYGSMFPFISLAQEFFQNQFAFDEVHANAITGLTYLISAFASPCFGFGIDRIGRNISWMVGAIFFSGVAHFLLMYGFDAYVAICLMGLAYSVLSSALWSLPEMLIPDNHLGTAFGIMQALQNLGTGVITIGAGSIVDSYGYKMLEGFFIIWIVIALISALAIMCIDYTKKGKLNLSKKERNRRIEEEKQVLLLEQVMDNAGNNNDAMDQICMSRESYQRI